MPANAPMTVPIAEETSVGNHAKMPIARRHVRADIRNNNRFCGTIDLQITGGHHLLAPFSIPFSLALGLAQLSNSISPDSSDAPEPPTTLSPLHPVSRNEAREARRKREARLEKSEIRSSKSETSTNDRNLNVPNGVPGGRQRFGHLGFVLGICFGFRASIFVLARTRVYGSVWSFAKSAWDLAASGSHSAKSFGTISLPQQAP